MNNNQSHLGLLLSQSRDIYEKTVKRYLALMEFNLLYEHEDERLLPGIGKVYQAKYNLYIWHSEKFGRIVWFFLDSNVPHMSSIVACIGIPLINLKFPMFVMNLNLKLDLKTYNVILGYRDNSNKFQFQGIFVPNLDNGPAPIYSQPSPSGFYGIRSKFILSNSSILWSLPIVHKCQKNWFNELQNAHPRKKNEISTALKYAEGFRLEMLSLHFHEGHIYDKLFGNKWLYTIFDRDVFDKIF